LVREVFVSDEGASEVNDARSVAQQHAKSAANSSAVDALALLSSVGGVAALMAAIVQQ
jgi:hypothetical protein